MEKYSEELDCLRLLFSDNQSHTAGEIAKYMKEHCGLLDTAAFRRLSILRVNGEVIKEHRGIYIKAPTNVQDENSSKSFEQKTL